MSRPLRIQYPNAFYHVMNRGLNRQTVFLIDDDYHIFLETLKETAGLLGLRIVSYCLMPNDLPPKTRQFLSRKYPLFEALFCVF